MFLSVCVLESAHLCGQIAVGDEILEIRVNGHAVSVNMPQHVTHTHTHTHTPTHTHARA